MYPNENNTPTSVDYLNQIAAKPQKGPGIFSKKPVVIGMIVLGIIFLLSLIGVFASVASSNIAPTERLAARLLSTEDTSKKAVDNIKNPQLRALNSSLALYMTNTIRDITPILAKNNVKVDKLSKNVTAAESNTKMLADLEDARLNVRFDRVYANKMSTQLENVLILMRQIYKNTKSSELKNFLDKAYNTLEPTQKEFADFNDTTS